MIDSSACILYNMAYTMLRVPVNPTIWELYAFPFLAQQNMQYEADQRPIIDTSIMTKNYRIVPSTEAMVIFFTLIISVVLICGMILGYSQFSPVPEATAFAEFDIASKVCKANREGESEKSLFLELSTQIAEIKTINLPPAFKDVKVKVSPRDDEENHDEDAISLNQLYER